MKTKIPSEEDIKSKGMVFTPPKLVNEMLDKLPVEFFTNASKTMLEPACGTGNFMVEFLKRRMEAGMSHLEALKSMYGIDIDQENVNICRQRLSLNSTDENIWYILKLNIVCADSLCEYHPGWNRTGFMWSKVVIFREIYPNSDIKEFDNFIIL